LGKKSKKAAASKRKEVMQEMIEDACAPDLNDLLDDMLTTSVGPKKMTRQKSGKRRNFVEGAI
jgi:hypothetical protein